MVLPGRMIERGTVRQLHTYPYTVVDDMSWASPYDAACVVVSLCLAGVPVLTGRLSQIVRSMIHPPLLAVSDGVGADTVLDPHRREALSIAIRRLAHRAYGFRPPHDPAYPLISVVIHPRDRVETARLMESLSAQSWENIHVHVVSSPERQRVHRRTASTHRPSKPVLPVSISSTDSLAGDVDRVGSVYLTRMVPAIAYGPHHLEDLVHALGHSGADVAHSPVRFSYDTAYGLVLERPRAVGELPGDDGLPGASLWYGDAGLGGVDRRGGYLGHGCNAVPREDSGRRTATAQAATAIVHRGNPPQLDWLKREPSVRSEGVASYFARSNSAERT